MHKNMNINLRWKKTKLIYIEARFWALTISMLYILIDIRTILRGRSQKIDPLLISATILKTLTKIPICLLIWKKKSELNWWFNLLVNFGMYSYHFTHCFFDFALPLLIFDGIFLISIFFNIFHHGLVQEFEMLTNGSNVWTAANKVCCYRDSARYIANTYIEFEKPRQIPSQ